MPKVSDITGVKFGRLTAVEHVGKGSGRSRNHFWRCQCECGAMVTVNGSCLRRGVTKSCGCLQKHIAKAAGDRTRTHGMTGTSTYNVWVGMVQRCHNANSKDYDRYGGRGIFVCDEWQTFSNFLADMGERPEGKSLDRIDNDKGYSPQNCRWADAKSQQRNKRNSRLITHDGKTMTLVEWAEYTGINQRTLSGRLKNGWDEISAITTPVDRKFSHQKNRKRASNVA